MIKRFNDKLALIITNGVSTMWCGYIFAGIALISLPSTLKQHSVNADVQWIAQTFLQLVLLSVIMVGQKVQAQMTINLHETIKEHHAHLSFIRAALHHSTIDSDNSEPVSTREETNQTHIDNS